MSNNPADSLEGVDLGNGWKVLEKITRKPNSTGGCFSIGYKVRDKEGREAFLKALDFSEALQDPDQVNALKRATILFTFERDLLSKCKDRKLSRVLTPITDGKVNIPGFGNWGTVHYLIFELAKGDIRNVQKDFEKLDLLWCLRSLHHVAVGLNQLHRINVAHQDLKPSNILVMGQEGTKITDLGRSSDQSQPSPWDGVSVAGDQGYAPLDLYYGDTGVDGFKKRLMSDLYLLGSLFFFHFSGVSAVQALRSRLRGTKLVGKSFREDLPYLQNAFEENLIDLKPEVEKAAGKLTEPIMQMVRQLCDPDPMKRGDPKWKGTIVPQYDLQRYVSSLYLLCERTEMELR